MRPLPVPVPLIKTTLVRTLTPPLLSSWMLPAPSPTKAASCLVALLQLAEMKNKLGHAYPAHVAATQSSWLWSPGVLDYPCLCARFPVRLEIHHHLSSSGVIGLTTPMQHHACSFSLGHHST
ncbi:hypothetical protein BC828DRAFT_393535 [Blastocladiella britannica]|nr:hypothetical protein BC828DRAFT_393535 [Blastocladiella britannica]